VDNFLKTAEYRAQKQRTFFSWDTQMLIIFKQWPVLDKHQETKDPFS
jgi:hypothetical protein